MSTQPYERQPGEPDKAWVAFVQYRDLGSARTLEKVSQSVRATTIENRQMRGKGGAALGALRRVNSRIEQWSSKWRWVQRGRAWDAEQDRVKRTAMLTELEEMGRRQAQQAVAGAQCLQLPYLALLQKMRDNRDTVDLLARQPVAELMKMVTASSMFLRQMHAAEREARGIQRMLEASLKLEASTAAIGPGAQTVDSTLVQAQIVGAEFGWVQGRCTCGHKHSDHDQENENPAIVPCTAAGCKCQSYRDDEDEPAED